MSWIIIAINKIKTTIYLSMIKCARLQVHLFAGKRLLFHKVLTLYHTNGSSWAFTARRYHLAHTGQGVRANET